MSFSELFIARPVMTCLLMIALVIFGAFGYSQLPVSELPNVDFPTIAVTTTRCPAPIRRPWPRRSPRRSRTSSPPSPGSIP